jgi:hypothetical protein
MVSPRLKSIAASSPYDAAARADLDGRAGYEDERGRQLRTQVSKSA